jgi:hypothetical protein
MKRAVITVGLGFGDEGKGATVDFLTRALEADLVVRYCGGSQAGHNVELPDGRPGTPSPSSAPAPWRAPTLPAPTSAPTLSSTRRPSCGRPATWPNSTSTTQPGS